MVEGGVVPDEVVVDVVGGIGSLKPIGWVGTGAQIRRHPVTKTRF
jgi:hypothetical protein